MVHYTASPIPVHNPTTFYIRDAVKLSAKIIEHK